MRDINFLNGTRFSDTANEVYRLPNAMFDNIDFGSGTFTDLLANYISDFKTNQLPRLEELKRYYLADNNIKYRRVARDKNRADNRIASDWAKYTVTFMQGYILGNPVEYKTDDEALLEKISAFDKQTNGEYHNALLETDLSIYGRAYELIYMNENSEPSLVKLNPESAFVVYDDSVDTHSLFGVRFYSINLFNNKTQDHVEVYTKDAIYHYEGDGKALVLTGEPDINVFGSVTINEYQNNEDRLGDYEAVLDSIDAYDLSQSELANFQQDTSDAYLVIKGNPFTGKANEYVIDEDGQVVMDEYGQPVINENSASDVLHDMQKARLLVLDNGVDGGVQPDAYYLKKEYDTAGLEAYKSRLVTDILRFTFTPDTSDANFGGVQSGEAMKYKLTGQDNLTKTKIRLLTKGFMRRLRLIGNVWSIKQAVDLYEAINGIVIQFTPNIPTSDSELMAEIQALYGVISDETLFELVSRFTGIDADVEMKRLAEQNTNTDGANAQQDYPNLNA